MIQCQRVYRVLLVLALSTAALSCRAPEDASNISAGSDTATDEAGIRAHVAAIEAAVNNRDFSAFAAQFVPDGDLVAVDGPIVSGQDAIHQAMEAAWVNAPPTRRVSITVEKIRFLGSDIAIVDAVARFTEGEPTQDRPTSVVVRRDGAWRIVVVRVLPAARG